MIASKSVVRLAQSLLLAMSLLAMAVSSQNTTLSNDFESQIPPLEGVGVKVRCGSVYDSFYKEAGEFDKAGSAAAATIMALLPSLLAFGPLKIANLRMLLHLGTAATLVTSVFTFGLPVEKLSTLQNSRCWKVKDLFGPKYYPEVMELFSGMKDDPSIQPEISKKCGDNELNDETSTQKDGHGTSDEIEATSSTPADKNSNTLDSIMTDLKMSKTIGKLIYLQRLYDPAYGKTDTPLLQKLHARATAPKRQRPWRLMIYFITAIYIVIQIALGFTVAYFIPLLDNIYFIWACPRSGYKIFVYWFGLTLVMVSVAQVFLESPFLHADEVLHLSRKPPRVRVVKCPTLAAVVGVEEEGGDSGRGKIPGFTYDRRQEITWTMTIWRRAVRAIRCLKQLEDMRKSTNATSPDLERNNSLPPFPKAGSPWDIAIHIIKRVIDRGLDPHPMVVILRPSAELLVPRNPLITFVIGYVQLIWLGLVSVFFGSTVGGTLVFTLAFVAAFVSTVAAARLASVALCWWLESRLDVLVIEYDSPAEQQALKVVLCSAGLVTVKNDKGEDDRRHIWIESQTGFYRYTKGYRITSLPCPKLGTFEICEHPPSLKPKAGDVIWTSPSAGEGEQKVLGQVREERLDESTTPERPSVGGWVFEVLCVFLALICGFFGGCALGSSLGVPWGYVSDSRDYGILVGSVAFAIGAVLFAFTVWEEAHATEGYKMDK